MQIHFQVFFRFFIQILFLFSLKQNLGFIQLLFSETAFHYHIQCLQTRFMKESSSSHLIKDISFALLHTVLHIKPSSLNKLLFFMNSNEAKLLELEKKRISFPLPFLKKLQRVWLGATKKFTGFFFFVIFTINSMK